MVRMRIVFAVVNAVSAEEKNADNSSNRIKTISCIVIVGLKKITSAFFKNNYDRINFTDFIEDVNMGNKFLIKI